ncbi:MAG: 2-hydroxymuconate tautomerase family protein [Candidatus Aminicenantes bacterium]|nr:2-hydroxymuconate tautomerase family protein [Candidatus Aminicenantes bacterium]
MPIIQVHLLEGRSKNVKRQLIRDLTDTTCRTLGVTPESVRVILQEMAPDHFGIAGEPFPQGGNPGPSQD